MKIEQSSSQSSFIKTINTIFALLTANIGLTIHNSFFWTIVDFLLFPLVWLKWIILHEVNLSIIQKSFEWFFK